MSFDQNLSDLARIVTSATPRTWDERSKKQIKRVLLVHTRGLLRYNGFDYVTLFPHGNTRRTTISYYFVVCDELPPCPVFLEIGTLSTSLLPLHDCKFLTDLISPIDDDSGSAASNNCVARTNKLHHSLQFKYHFVFFFVGEMKSLGGNSQTH